MTYSERIRGYEKDKIELRRKNLSDKDYERELKKLIDKWGI